MPQNPLPTLIPTFAGPNYAPIKPILLAQDTNKPIEHKVCDALKEKFQHFNKLNDRAFNQIFAVGKMVASFESGDQIPIARPFTGGIATVTPTRQDESTKRGLNQMQFYATKTNQMWMASKPNVTITPGRRIDSAMMAARGANALVDFYETKFYSEKFELEQAGLARTMGTYIVRFRWDMGVQGLTAIREIVENKTIKAHDGMGYCGDCETVGPAAMFQQQSQQMPEHDDMQPGQSQMAQMPSCPKCGGMAVNVIPEQSVNVQNVTGTEQQNLGDLICEQWPITGARWDLFKSPEDSDHLILKRLVSAGQIKALVGQIKLPQNNSGSDSGLDVQRMLAHSGQAVGGKNAGGVSNEVRQETVTLEEMWLSAADVEDIMLEGNEQTVSGQEIPKGRLSEICPGGLVCVGINGMSTILGIYQESHKDMIVSGVYHPKVMSGAGRGAVDSVEVQRRFNTLDSQQLMQMNANATPGMIYRPEAFQAGADVDYIALPSMMTPLTDLPQGMSLDDVVRPLPPGAIAPAIVQYTQQFLNNQAQMASHCTEFSGALPGVDNKTAHGAELAASLAQSLFAPMLLVKAYTRRRSAEIMVNLWRKHQVMPQYFPLSGKKNGTDGLYLKAADLDVDLLYSVEDGSESPKTPLSRRMALQSVAQGFGNLGSLVQAYQQFPKLVKPILLLSGLESLYEDDDEEDVTTICRKRLVQMQAREKQGAQTPQDLLAAIEPAISDIEENQSDCSDWWRAFLTTEDGQTASPLMRSAVEALAALQAQNDSQIQSVMAGMAGQVQAAMAAPAAIGQAQLQQAQAQHGAELQQQGAEQAHGHAIQQQAHAASVQPPAQGPPPDEPEPPPEQKVAESAAYKDLPPEAQYAMLTQQMGLKDIKLSDVVAVHQATLDNQKLQATQKIAAMKPKPVATTGAKK